MNSLKSGLSHILILAMTSLLAACGAKEKKDDGSEAILAMNSNLQAIETGFVPESISDSGSSVAPAMAKNSDNEDICEGLDLIQCQPRLIRLYLVWGRGAVGLARGLVSEFAGHMKGVEDGASGTFYDEAANSSVYYSKRSALDFDLVVLKGNQPVARVSANPLLYTIQFDLNELDKDKPNTRGGKIEIQVAYADRSNWKSRITVTGQKCNPLKPDDPENARIDMNRAGELWSGQAMFYSGTSATFGIEKSCNLQPGDNTSLLTYTDLVADRKVAKANLYMFKRTETSTAQIQNFGLPSFCENYPDYCQSIAVANNTSPAALDNLLNGHQNSYCVQQGRRDVTFNSTCEGVSPTVSEAPFLDNSNWVTPSDFSRLEIQIPNRI